MNVDLIITGLIAAVPGLLAVGGLLVKVNRLESDMSLRVSREVFDLHIKNLDEKLTEIKAMLTVSRFQVRREDTGPFPRSPRGDE